MATRRKSEAPPPVEDAVVEDVPRESEGAVLEKDDVDHLREEVSASGASGSAPSAPSESALVVADPQPIVLRMPTMDPVDQMATWGKIGEYVQQLAKKYGLTWKDPRTGKENLKVEVYTGMMQMLGAYPYTVWTRAITDSNGKDGWESRVEWRAANGQVVCAGEGMCSRSEYNWSKRDDFSIRAMAQTRATGRGPRMAFGFILSIAGYDPAPAEEWAEYEQRDEGSSGRWGGDSGGAHQSARAQGSTPPPRREPGPESGEDSKRPGSPSPSAPAEPTYHEEPYEDRLRPSAKDQKRVKSALKALRASIDQHKDVGEETGPTGSKRLKIGYDLAEAAGLKWHADGDDGPAARVMTVDLGYHDKPSGDWILCDLTVAEIEQFAAAHGNRAHVGDIPF